MPAPTPDDRSVPDPDARARPRDDDGADDAADDPLLDAEFPLGDGVADLEAVVYCPYCGEPNEIGLDPGGGERQEYVEDCQVCCQPWHVHVAYHADGTADVYVDAADGS
jgi:hypothetical protein